MVPSQPSLRRVKVPGRECPDHSAVSTSNPAATLPSQCIGPSGLLVDYTHVTGTRGVVVFGHAGGSGRSSPRNRLVAGVLHDYGLSTLMVDLLPMAAPTDPSLFDVPLLSARLAEAMDWLRVREPAHGARVALLGIGTCGAAALRVAAQWPQRTAAVVTRGGRPDLVADYVRDVRSPTLMIVGGNDADVVELNRRAAATMRCEHRLDVLPGSTQRFEEPGALEAVAHLSGAWFAKHAAAPNAARVAAPSA